MASTHSDTSLLDLLKEGRHPRAAQDLWQRYFGQLVALARRKLHSSSRRTADEEDIALSAFNSFFKGVAAGRFPKLDDRQDLWQVLVMLTERKVVNQIRRLAAAKRGGKRVRGESFFVNPVSLSSAVGLNDLGSPEPTPEFVATFADQCRTLFLALEDPELRVVASLKMEGFTTEEIAKILDRAPRSIERKLRTIRKVWEQKGANG